METPKNDIREEGLRSLSSEGLAILGTDQVAYVRPHDVNGQTVFVVHGANGKELAGFDNRNSALAACYEHELEAVSLH
ncbi:MAG: DUF1150 family protein [Rhodospirillaceae bacterium]|mgnify:CR=1|jgi:hypothetical protein|nr:DUF1150 family protein [Rhodospirillaceae bacterium]MBT4689704.1 DUF1150 family protein [Rhodospirillaceae bacterium]MBT5879285.1 DUF1150 family protein [Rhodospirillaceae bacterium]MBT6589659.1 DUF1150 family protein [Rhodospirillaceae bacterium]MBT6910558.1 DUF1150 family protein [Rhodospirillaceae bacterium]